VISLLGETLDSLTEALGALGHKPYRARQVMEWVHEKRVGDFASMTDLPAELRAQLAEKFPPAQLEQVRMSGSKDTTRKFLFRLPDGQFIESVFIPASPALYGETSDRRTLCVSTQVGCAYGCKFCASGLRGWKRNLSPGEITAQVMAVEQATGERVDNIVFMGMGEPLMNYKNTLEAIDRITSPKGLGLSPKRITLSTVGLPKMIRKLADDGVKFNLAVSLHSARDEVRAQIMPVNDVAPIADLRSSLEYWYTVTKRKVTFEYVVWRDVNDQPEDVQALVELAKRVPCKVNLIEYNAIGDARFRQASPEALQAYVDGLARIGVVAKVRRSRGKDIDAACGQLANKKLPAELSVLD
jgi:23S rRNA (adenine2503-C2)-methyltransferase